MPTLLCLNCKVAKRKSTKKSETDSTYLLKLVVYLIVGSMWLRVAHGSASLPLPFGFVVGLVLAMHDHFRTDRHIEYAVLLIAMFIGFFAQIGILVAL